MAETYTTPEAGYSSVPLSVIQTANPSDNSPKSVYAIYHEYERVQHVLQNMAKDYEVHTTNRFEVCISRD
jgi:hypothetical protein